MRFMLVVLLFTIIFIPSLCSAQDLYTIEITDTLMAFISLVFGLGSVIVTWFSGLILSNLNQKLRLDIDDKTQMLIEGALISAVRWAEKQAIAKAQSITDPQIQSELIADMVNMVLKAIPAVVKKLNLKQQDIEKLLYAKLPKSSY